MAGLHREAAEAQCRIAELRGRQDDRGSPARKVELFADLFAGRTDVFPLRWESRDRRKSGWAPRCDNEWKPGICQKPRIKCGECSHQAFVPDAPRLDTLFVAMPIAWKGTLTQYAGRLHRAHAGKREVRVYDYVDAEVPVLRRMHAKRLTAYRSLGYELSAEPSLL